MSRAVAALASREIEMQPYNNTEGKWIWLRIRNEKTRREDVSSQREAQKAEYEISLIKILAEKHIPDVFSLYLERDQSRVFKLTDEEIHEALKDSKKDLKIREQFAKLILNADEHTEALFEIFKQYLELNDFTNARRIAKSFADGQDQDYALIMIIDKYIETYKIEEINFEVLTNLLSELKETINKMSCLETKNKFLFRFFRYASDIMAESLPNLEVIFMEMTSSMAKDMASIVIIDLYTDSPCIEEQRNFKKAEDLKDQIDDPSFKDEALIVIINKYLKRGNMQDAQRLAMEISGFSLQHQILQKIESQKTTLQKIIEILPWPFWPFSLIFGY